METFLTQGLMHFRVTDISSRISLDQENGLIRQVQELFVIGDKIGEELPDGTHVSLQIKSYSAEYEKDATGNFILGYLTILDNGLWHLSCLMKNEIISEIRESFRHWQKTKIGEAFVFVTLSGEPNDIKNNGHVLVRGVKFSFPEASRWNKGEEQRD
jgi:hypothetical protein